MLLSVKITSADWKNHPLRCHRPSCLPKHERLHLPPALFSLGVTQREKTKVLSTKPRIGDERKHSNITRVIDCERPLSYSLRLTL